MAIRRAKEGKGSGNSTNSLDALCERARRAVLYAETAIVLLDYDGTLTNIVPAPKDANLSVRAKDVLERLAGEKNARVGIISGRALDDVCARVGIQGIWYAGNHGFEMLIGGKRIDIAPKDARDALAKLADELRRATSVINGVIVEDKGATVALHFRMVDKGQVADVKQKFERALAPYRKAHILRERKGKKVLEAWPALAWNKGMAIMRMLDEADVDISRSAAFYFGDDATDEDAFQAVNGLDGNHQIPGRAITVFVGSSDRTCARFRVGSPFDVVDCLYAIDEALFTKTEKGRA